MKTKRALALLLVLAMTLTTLGVVPATAASAAVEEDDTLLARWTTQDNLTPADLEIEPHSVSGLIPGEDAQSLPIGENALKASDIVTVIVELEDAPLSDVATQSVGAYALTAAGKQYESTLLTRQAAVRARLEKLVGSSYSTASINGASERAYSYTTVLNGFSMKLPYGKLAEARETAGVKRIWIAEQYSLPTTFDSDSYTISMTSSTGMIGASEVNALGYDGSGTIVAILDTGFMKEHEAFSVMPTDVKYEKSDIAALLKSSTLSSGITDAEAVYVNEKAPYAYDYAGGDTNAEAVGQAHGVHVAGTVAGNNGEDFFGVAPNAQLMIMKIFADNSGSTSDDVILAGVDDAVKLGADSINMSLGSPAGFTAYGDEGESETDALTYAGVYTRAEKAGVNVMVAAGNENSSTYYNSRNNLTLAEYPDNGIVASPSTLPASMSVASVDNVKLMSCYLMLGDTVIGYNNAVDNATSESYDILDALDGQTAEYVMVPGIGEASDYAGLNVSGKIAVVSRGTSSFGDKAKIASEAGAIACIIYDNVLGARINAALEAYYIPVITISKADGAKLAAAEEKKLSFSRDYYGLVDNPAAAGVSSFSSKGPAPDLSIKPEISAPGGSILSSVLGSSDAYEIYSGTSMATPHMAGEAALLRQYLQEAFPDLSGEALGDLVNSLLMSTAVPSVELNGTYYPVRRQGAGVANIANAIQSGAYLSVAGSERPKAEVGSSESGVYSFTATVHNMTADSKSYTIDTTAMIETITELNGEKLASNSNRNLTSSEVRISYTGLASGNRITVAGNSTATFTVKIELTAAGRKAYENDYPNGSYVEAFTILTADEGVNLTIPVLGFYGDWDALDVVQGTWDEGTPNITYSVLADVNASLSGSYVGVNNITDTFSRRWMGFGPARGGRTLMHLSSLLRNTEMYQIIVTNEDGDVMWDSGDLGWARKTYIAYSYTGYQATTTLVQQGWNGRLPGEDGSYNAGDWAPDGNYTFALHTRGVGSDVEDVQSYDFYVDNTRPVLEDAELYEDESGNLMLALTVSDNKYLQYVWVIDSAQQYYYLEAAEEFRDMEAGDSVRIVMDASDLVASLSLNAANPGRVGIMMGDCANNTTTTFIDIGPQGIEIDATTLSIGERKTLSYKVYPESMQDIALEWSSSDETVATVDENGIVTGLSDGTVRITATAFSRLSSYCIVTIGQGVHMERNFSEAPRLGEVFTTEDGLWYRVSGADTVTLLPENNKQNNYSGSYSSMPEITVPATVEYESETYRVTALAPQAFYFNYKTTSITLSEGLESIGGSAFFYCTRLTELVLPDTVKTIGDMAFAGVTGRINIPASIEYIGDNAYIRTGVETADFPNTLTYIGEKAFMNCTKLTTLILPDSVESYGNHAFYGCTALTYVELPQNMTKIPKGLLWDCTSLKRIQIPASVEVIGDAAFYGCSALEKLVLPENLKTIEQWAFCSTNLKEIVIPDSVETIGYHAFIYCNGVEHCQIGSGVQSIGQDAFYFWMNKTEDQTGVMHVKNAETAKLLRYSGYGHEILVNGAPYTSYFGSQFTVDGMSYMPTSETTVELTVIGDGVATEKFEIPATVTNEGDGRTYTVTSLGDRLLFQDQAVIELTLPDTIEKVGERTFDQMFNLRYFSGIPANLKYVGYQAFGYLGWERQLEINGLIPEWQEDVLNIPGTIEYMDQCAFAGNRFKTINVGEGITELSDYSLSYNNQGTTQINLPSTLTRIGLSAVSDCYDAQVNLPENLEYIGKLAFAGTPVAETIHLPENVTYIGDKAFNASLYTADYTSTYYVGPTTIYLNGKLSNIGSNVFRPDATVIAVLNSQRNMVAGYTTLDTLPTVIWDGKTDIGYNDGSCIPEGVTVTVTGDVTIDGKLCIEGTLIVAEGANLTITENAVIEGADNITYQTCPSEAFSDLNTAEWYHEAIDYVLNKGLMNGMSRDTFAPNAEMTRAQLVTVLYRMAGSPSVEGIENPFTDAAADAWFVDAVLWAADSGIVKGTAADTFSPNAPATREQFVTILYRYAEAEVTEEDFLSSVPDASSISDYAREAMNWAVATGLIQGDPSGKVTPLASATRAQIATLLMRFCEAD